MNKHKAKFIVLEGIDGTGKTTTARQLKQYYEAQGKSVKIYYEPYQFASFNVKDIIKNLESEKVDISDFAILNLMIASRDISIKNILIPALNWYDIVIADRYYYSTYAYQWKALDDNFLMQRPFDKINCNYPVPDKIIFFKIIDLENYQNSKSDKFEIQDISKFKDIQSSYIDSFNHISDVRIFDDVSYDPELTIIKVNQQKQPYFDFNQVLQALEGI